MDLSLCVLTVPVCLAKGGIKPLYSPFIAHYYAYFGWSLSIASQILSFYLMGMFAFERFLAVCRHDLYPRTQTDRVFRCGVVAAAVFVLLFYVPTMAVGHVDDSEGQWKPVDGYSQQHYGWYWSYALLREIFSRLVPAIVITFCNVRITLRLKQLRNIREGFGSSVSAARRERERRLVLLLFWVTILFYIFNTPVTVYYLGYLHSQRFCGSSLPAKLLTFSAISNLLQMVGNVSYFILYFLISPEFHRTLCNLLTCRHTGSAAGDKSKPANASNMLPTTTAVITTTIIVRASEGESPAQSDSGYQHDLPDGSTPLPGSRCFLVEEDSETSTGGRA